MIEFKDGAVCYAFNHQWRVGDKIGDGSGGVRSVDLDVLKSMVEKPDFQLNTIKQGDYIEASELDTEQKYNDAVEVFGLFGCAWGESAYEKYDAFRDGEILIWSVGLYQASDFHKGKKRKLTYNQLMAIGELKRKVDEQRKDLEKRVFHEALDECIKPAKKPRFEISDDLVSAGNILQEQFEINPTKYTEHESAFNRIKMAELEKCKVDFEMEKSIKRNKSKQAYDILKGMGIEYDLVKQQWYKKQYI